MASIGSTDALPGNLSKQQQFILAFLAIERGPDGEDMPSAESREWRHPGELQPFGCSYRLLTLAVAHEFDDGEGSRLGKRHVEVPEYRRSRTLEVTDQHRSSLAASVRRLEERGYLIRWGGSRGGALWPTSAKRGKLDTKYVVATDKGLRAGREAIRRHQDGRYSLEFDLFSADADPDSDSEDVELPD